MANHKTDSCTPQTVARCNEKQNWLWELLDQKDEYEEIGCAHRSITTVVSNHEKDAPVSS
jgi:hypothetical protein